MNCMTLIELILAAIAVGSAIGIFTARHINRCNDLNGRCEHIGFSPKESRNVR